jgi:hypothetical protein
MGEAFRKLRSSEGLNASTGTVVSSNVGEIREDEVAQEPEHLRAKGEFLQIHGVAEEGI